MTDPSGDLAATQGSRAGTVCTIVGSAAVALGVATFLLGGGGAHLAALARLVLALPEEGIILVSCLTALAAVGLGGILWGEQFVMRAFVLAVIATGIAMMAFLAGATAFGWTRLVDLHLLEDAPAIGSPAMGLGALAAAVGIVAIAYCRTPLLPPPAEGERPRPQDHRKVNVAMFAAVVLIVLPGLVGAAAPGAPEPGPAHGESAPIAPSRRD